MCCNSSESLEKDLLLDGKPTAKAMVESAKRHVEILEKLDFYDICISLKASDLDLCIEAYEEASKDFEKKLNKTVKLVTDIYEQLDDIENMYDLNKEDVKIIDEVNKDLIVIKDDHHKMLEKVKNKATPYSSVNDEVEKLSNRLKQVESTLDIALKSLGNMYEDEQRAR